MTRTEILQIRKANRRQLRKKQTEAEKTLWKHLRDKNFGIRFRRQYSFGRYVVDFYAYQTRLVIEVDGGIHDEPDQKEYDAIRTNYLEKIGCSVLRFTNDQVMNDLDLVINTIRKNITDRQS